MTFRQMEYILKIHEEGGISKAAGKLNVSQPALTQCVKAIEEELGAEIFLRKHYPLALTYAGERLFKTIREILRLEKNLHNEISDITKEQVGRLRVGMSMLKGAAFLPDILPEFEKLHPKIEVSIIEQGSVSLASLVQQDVVDIALLANDEVSQNQIFMEPICADSVFLCAGPQSNLYGKFRNGTEVSIREIENNPLIAIKEGHGLHVTQSNAFKRLKKLPVIRYEVESAVLGMKLVSSSDAVMLCPYSVFPVILTPDIHIFPIQEKSISNMMSIGYSHETYVTRYMKDFIEITKKVIRATKNNPAT